MAGITQTIPNYYGGISEQPDQLKNPGQVKEALNTIPDITYGLYKRPGSKRVVSDQASGQLANVQSNGSWFHYYRDETEGSYIGQIASDGTPRIWRCSDAKEMTIAYGSTNGATSANLKTYLTPSSATATEDIQFCTINDTTFVNNRTKKVLIGSATTAARPDTHSAFVEILRTENGRQYALNVHDSSTTVTNQSKATRIKISDTSLATGWGTGNCPGIGTQVFAVTAASSYGSDINSVKDASNNTLTSGREDLVFRITTLGQVGDSQADDDGGGPGPNGFRCAYNKSIDLLHGGQGWAVGDVVQVTLDSADTNYTYDVEVTAVETTSVRGTINSGVNGIIRPEPTPWDAQTAVSVDTILGGLNTELAATGLTRTIIGNGIYLSSSSAFTVEVTDPDLMRVMQHEINDVSKLPSQCRHGYIVKVTNSQQSEEDDYYLKFNGDNNQNGPGSWVECPAPGIRKNFDHSTMPVTIQRTAATTFTVDRYAWDDRTVGDDKTNPIPTFVGLDSNHPDHTGTDEDSFINKILFFRNRLTFLSGPNVIASQPGDSGNFWADTALTVSGIDPIDISMSSTLPSSLFDGIEINAGLLVFSANSQHLLSADDTILNPDTAKLRTISSYNYNTVIPPISLGTTLGFIDNSNKYSRFNEMANVSREGQAAVVDQTKIVPTLLPKDIDHITNSRENGLIFFGKTNSDIVYGFKTVTMGDQRLQSAWFKWKLNRPLKYHFVENDRYYFVDSDNFLQYTNLTQNDDDPSITEEGTNFLIHLDNWVQIEGGSYNNSTNLTTFTDGSNSCEFTWQSSIGANPNGQLVVIDIDPNSSRVGRYAPVTVTSAGTSFTLPGDWSREVTSVTVTNGGSGYTSAPTVAFSGGAGSNVTATATIASGAVTAVTINNNGQNYTSAPTVSFSGGGGSSAAATAAIHDGKYYIGYLYDYQVDFPRFYTTKTVGQASVADTSASLILHRLNLSLGKVGLYETTLTRIGKPDFTDVYESTLLNTYNVSDAPLVDEIIKTIPVYDKNKNVDITLKSTHPSPCTLRSMQWEGDYSPMYYRRG